MAVNLKPKQKPWEKPIGNIELNTLKPDPQQALKEEDPAEVMLANMRERGFDSLWSGGGSKDGRHLSTGFTDKVKLIFLRHYAVNGRLAYSAALAGVSRYTVNTHKRKDPIFAEALEEARAYFRDLLAEEMFRRGVSGYEEGVVGGKNRDEVIMVPKYSDRMLELLARVHLPALKKEPEQKTADQVNPTVVNQFNFSNLNAEDLAMAKKLLENQTKVVEGEVVDESDA